MDGVDPEQKDAKYEDCRRGDDAREQGTQYDGDPEDSEASEDARKPPGERASPGRAAGYETGDKAAEQSGEHVPAAVRKQQLANGRRLAEKRNDDPYPESNQNHSPVYTALTMSLIVQGTVRPELRWVGPLTS